MVFIAVSFVWRRTRSALGLHTMAACDIRVASGSEAEIPDDM